MFQSIRAFRQRILDLPHTERSFTIRLIGAIIGLAVVGACMIVDNFLPTPLSDYQCPDFYDLRFGTPIADAIQQVQDAGGPLPDNYDEIDLTAKEASTLVYSDMDLPFTGLSGAQVSCYFEASPYPLRPPYLREVTINPSPTEANYTHLLAFLNNYYGRPFESTAQPGKFHWNIDKMVTIWLYPVTDETLTVRIRLY